MFRSRQELKEYNYSKEELIESKFKSVYSNSRIQLPSTASL